MPSPISPTAAAPSAAGRWSSQPLIRSRFLSVHPDSSRLCAFHPGPTCFFPLPVPFSRFSCLPLDLHIRLYFVLYGDAIIFRAYPMQVLASAQAQLSTTAVVTTPATFITAVSNAANLLPVDGPPLILNDAQAAGVGRLLAALAALQSSLGAAAAASGTAMTGVPGTASQQAIDGALQRLAIAAMRGRGADEVVMLAGGTGTGAWSSVHRLSLDKLLSTGAELPYLCNISDPTPGGGGGCAQYDRSVVVVLPPAVATAINKTYHLSAGALVDVAVTAFPGSPLAFIGAAGTTFGPAVRLTFLAALNASQAAPSDPTMTIKALTGSALIQASCTTSSNTLSPLHAPLSIALPSSPHAGIDGAGHTMSMSPESVLSCGGERVRVRE